MQPSSLTSTSGSSDSASRPCIILFYKYHPLSDDHSIVELFKLALETFCVSLGLKGRILVGCSKHRSEGINGTLSGTKANLEIFVRAFAKHDKCSSAAASVTIAEASGRFRIDCEAFYKAANCPPLEMEESEFKWSELDSRKNSNNSNSNKIGVVETKEETLFPDLNIKIVNELIGTGGVLSSIQIDELHKGYLTPQEWHERISELQVKTNRARENCDDLNVHDDNNGSDTILIDCRNTKECSIGNFVGSIDPQTTTFNQFPKWVDDHKHKLRNKNVLMYCTGGIRCEKASAYVRQAMGSSVKEVRHLKGGIHKYLESYGGSGGGNEATTSIETEAQELAPTSVWRGKNFVFDGRGAHGPGASSGSAAGSTNITATAAIDAVSSAPVGSCRYCEAPYDSFDPHCVCTVCKEPILVCKTCQLAQTKTPEPRPEEASCASGSIHQAEQPTNRPQHLFEYHCLTHKHLEGCYFTNLEGFSQEELTKQRFELETFAKDIAVGKKFRTRRKTLAKQRAKIESRLETMGRADGCAGSNTNSNGASDGIELKCRNCGQIGCSGKCWGFHGLKRKRVLERSQKETKNASSAPTPSTKPLVVKNKQNERLKQQKELKKQSQIEEWIASGLTLGPKIGRDPSTGLRVPKPCVRVLETSTKGKWCGLSLLKVLKTEFPNSFQLLEPQQKHQHQHQHASSLSAESQVENTLRTLLQKELIRVNGTPIKSLDEANAYKLKNMDVIDRILLWHEPPIHLPSETIHVQKIPIPEEFLPASKARHDSTAVSDNHIYVCNKPSTVPVHPAGPYLSNSLTMLVEAQEGFRPKTLTPCHRIDRVTSGMTICCTDSRVAKLVQTTMATKASSFGSCSSRACVSKQYLARVVGRFPSIENDETTTALPILSNDAPARWDWIVHDRKMMITSDEFDSIQSAMFVQVDAPIETVDPLNGVRKITQKGKASTSLFRFLEYDAQSDTSIIICVPVTGRSHQLRVHLEWLGYSIVNDIQYGGAREEIGISNTAIDPSSGIQRMMENVREYNSRAVGFKPFETKMTVKDTAFSSPITDEQARAAREVCPTCDVDTEGRGPSSAFSPAQLLQGGHSICLHAYRYSLVFPSEAKQGTNQRKRKQSNGKMSETGEDNASSKNGTAEDDVDTAVFRVDLRVDLPSWASHLRKSASK